MKEGDGKLPTIAIIGSYRFFFYSEEGMELPHVHVRRDRATAKFWLEPVRLANSKRFRGPELRSLQDLVEEKREQFLEVWNEYFGH